MSLPVVDPRKVIIGNGTRGPFSLTNSGTPIRVRDATDLIVRRYSSTTDETGTALTLNTDYTVSNTDVDAATVTLASGQAVLSSTQRLVVTRKQGIEDVIALTSGGDFSGPALAAAISVLSEQLQELRSGVDRSIKVDWYETTERAVPLAPATETKLLGRTTTGAIVHMSLVDATEAVDPDWVPILQGDPSLALESITGEWADLASATTTELDSVTSDNVRITGTTTITSLGTATNGLRRTLRFAGALVLTHNGTSLILPGAANITTAADDTAEFASLGSGNWICVSYKRASGLPLGMGATWTTALADTTANAAENLGTKQDGSSGATRKIRSKLNDWLNLKDMYAGSLNAEDEITAGNDITAFLDAAIAKAKTEKKKIILPGGSLKFMRPTISTSDEVTANLTLPVWIEGQGDHKTTLYANRSTYTTGGTPLLWARYGTGFYLGGVKIDCDDAVFKNDGSPTSGAYALALNFGSDQILEDVTLVGYFYSGLFRTGVTKVSTRGVKITSRWAQARCLSQQGTGNEDNTDYSPRIYGVCGYPITLNGGKNTTVYNSRDETSSVFGTVFAGETGSRLIGGWAKDTEYEAFNITNSKDTHFSHLYAEWTVDDWSNISGDPGVDMGVSINGETFDSEGNPLDGTDGCSMSNIKLRNSYARGAGIANHTKNSRIYGFEFYNCGLRYAKLTPNDSGASTLFIGAGESLAVYVGAVCQYNKIHDGLIMNTEGAIPKMFSEIVTSGRRNWKNACENVQVNPGGYVALEQLSAGSRSWVVDAADTIRVSTPTVLAGTANPTASAEIRWQRRGRYAKILPSRLTEAAKLTANSYLGAAAPVPLRAAETLSTAASGDGFTIAAPTTLSTASSGDGFSISSNVVTRQAGSGQSFVSDGLTVGMVVRMGNLTTTADNDRDCRVMTVTATTLGLMPLDGGDLGNDGPDTNATVGRTNVVTRQAGASQSFIADDIEPGMVVVFANLATSGDNARPCLVTAVTATTLTVKPLDGGTLTTVGSADTDVTISTQVGRYSLDAARIDTATPMSMTFSGNNLLIQTPGGGDPNADGAQFQIEGTYEID